MSFTSESGGDEGGAVAGARLIPRITIQAFCEHSQTAEMVEAAVHDRRMSKVALSTQNGGIDGAVETFKENPTPNLVIIETSLPPEEMPAALTRLAEVCDAETRLIILGHVNDVVLYRELIKFGVSEYLVLPSDPQTLVTAISEIFDAESSTPLGRTVAFLGAKGGVGSSTLSHNVAWSIAQKLKQDVLILDMDLAFGIAGLNFNQEPAHGIGDAVFANEKMDGTMLDRLMSKAAAHINLMTAPAVLDQTYDPSEKAFEQIVELSQKSVPVVILDMPHMWSAWVRATLATVDEIVIVAEPDLANLRNAKSLSDTLKDLRPADSRPLLLMNREGIAKRPEIAAAEFAESVDCDLVGQVPFEAVLFGTAANNGQMIAEVNANHRINDIFDAVGMQVTGRSKLPESGKSGRGKITMLSKILKRA